MIAEFYQRNDLNSRLVVPNLVFETDSLAWDVQGGGPEQAMLRATGSRMDLYNLLEMLRCPVVIRDLTQRDVWWGYVEAVNVNLDGLVIGASLANMYNRVAVAYSYIEPGTSDVGARATTTWVQDDDSIAMYGTKEFLSSCSGMTTAGAEALRDAFLANHRLPSAPPAIAGRGQFAMIQCRGWLETLGWRYTSIAAGSGVDSTEKISQIYAAANQYMVGLVIEAASGVNVPPYLAGDTDGLIELTELLRSGGANGRRLLATVHADRSLWVAEEQEKPADVFYQLGTDRSIQDWKGVKLEDWRPPIGRWLRLAEIEPGVLEPFKIFDPSVQFLEGATWSKPSGLQPRFKGQPSIQDITAIRR